MSVPDAKRLKEREVENIRLKKFLAEQMFEHDVIKEVMQNSRDRADATRLGATLEHEGSERAADISQPTDLTCRPHVRVEVCSGWRLSP